MPIVAAIGPLDLIRKFCGPGAGSGRLHVLDVEDWSPEVNRHFIERLVRRVLANDAPACLLLPRTSSDRVTDSVSAACVPSSPGGPPRVLALELEQILEAGIRFVVPPLPHPWPRVVVA